MTVTQQIAKQLRDVHFGGNWTVSTFNEHLADVTWEQAIAKVASFNTIAALVYHVNYYVEAALMVLQDRPLTAKDADSFDHPPVASREDWENLLSKTRADVEMLAGLIEKLPDSRLSELFVNEKYGTYYRNLTGIVEHAHYHLGQIVLIKKMLPAAKK